MVTLIRREILTPEKKLIGHLEKVKKEICAKSEGTLYYDFRTSLNSLEGLCTVSDDLVPIIDIINYKMNPRNYTITINDEDAYMNARRWFRTIVANFRVGIKDFIDFLNKKSCMSDAQIDETVEMIMTDHQWITLYDIPIFVGLCKRGYFGTIYDVNGTAICVWFRQYKKDRFNTLNEYYTKKKNEEDEREQYNVTQISGMAQYANAIAEKCSL